MGDYMLRIAHTHFLSLSLSVWLGDCIAGSVNV